MLKVAFTGTTGLIGTRIIELLEPYFTFIPILQEEIDITNESQIKNKINEIDFDIFLHLAAYTNVDQAEKDHELATLINVKGTKNVYEAVQEKKKKFIYISTDFVFDGKKPPFYENTKPHPFGVYAVTKYAGEQIIKDGMIVRISYPYRAVFDAKKDFVRSIIYLLSQKKTVHMVNNSFITPTFIDDIVFSLKYLISNYKPNIYHIVGSDSLSPYKAGKKIAKIFALDQKLIQPITYAEYFKNKAYRPQYSKIKSKNNTFYKMKPFEEGLKIIKSQIEK